MTPSPAGSAGDVSPAPGNEAVLRLVAPNPGPMTLQGTNTYVVGRDPAYVVDPGPTDPEHLAAVREAAEERGGIAGVLLTHSHADHSAGVPLLGAPLLHGEVSEAAEFAGSVPAARAEEAPAAVGPFTVIPTPGHAPDHVCLVWQQVCFCGDLILGEGSSIVPPSAFGGSMVDYMRSLEAVGRIAADLFCPGHGPWITDPQAKVAEYVDHRLDREQKLLAALDGGERSREALLDAAWDDVPAVLRPAALLAMRAHLEKLDAEGLLPDDLRD